MQIVEKARESLLPYRGKKLIVAVSGGLDSVALLDILLRLREELGLELIVSHVDHGLRRSSRKDAEFVMNLAAAYSLPAVTTRLELNPGGNLEARAREARYRWLDRVRKRRKADYVVTAHQADDQVETLLLRLARGSGLTGLRGMQAERDRIIRPLLDVPRKDLTRYVRRHRLRYRLDPTNKSLKIARNRVRRQVVTALSRINPQLIETVSQSMRVLDEEYDVLRHLAEQEVRKATLRGKTGTVALSVTKLRRLRRGMRHLVWRETLREFLGSLDGFRLQHLENIDELLRRQTGSLIHLPHDVIVRRSYDRLVFSVGQAKPPRRQVLDIPGTITFGETTVTARSGRGRSGRSITVDAAAIGRRLIVRSPKAGDRFKPAGMRGSKLVSDLLIDAKVPRDERPWVPVVTTTRGEIVWVAGHRADRRFAAVVGKPAIRLAIARGG